MNFDISKILAEHLGPACRTLVFRRTVVGNHWVRLSPNNGFFLISERSEERSLLLEKLNKLNQILSGNRNQIDDLSSTMSSLVQHQNSLGKRFSELNSTVKRIRDILSVWNIIKSIEKTTKKHRNNNEKSSKKPRINIE
jgi:hypothetical protein